MSALLPRLFVCVRAALCVILVREFLAEFQIRVMRSGSHGARAGSPIQLTPTPKLAAVSLSFSESLTLC